MWLNNLKKYYFSSTPPPAPETIPTPPNPNTPWYAVSMEEATFLTQNFIRDFLWPIFTRLGWDYIFRETEDFLRSSLGQLIWTSAGVIVTTPLTAYIWHKVYGRSYKECLMFSGIAAFSALFTIVPWNATAYICTYFYKNQGLSDTAASYLGAIFPGPGFAEGPLQTLTRQALLCIFLRNRKYEINPVTVAIDVSPLSYVTGNAWLVTYNITNPAKKHVGGLIGQALAVSSTVGILNYFTLKTTDALAPQIEKCIHKKPTTSHRPTFFSKSHGTTVYYNEDQVPHDRKHLHYV